MVNLFDEDPPIVTDPSQLGFSPYGDPRGRRVVLALVGPILIRLAPASGPLRKGSPRTLRELNRDAIGMGHAAQVVARRRRAKAPHCSLEW